MPNEKPLKNVIETWGDVNNLLASSDKKDGPTIAGFATAFGLPYFGITLLQGKPYINTLGLNWIWSKHPQAITLTQHIRLSKYTTIGQNEVALVKVSGILENKSTVSAIGSASANNLRGQMVAYPNEMAETRAINRLLRRALSPYIYQDFFENVKTMGAVGVKLLKEGKIHDIISVSAEEIGETENGMQDKPIILTNEEHTGILKYLESLNSAKSMTDITKISEKVRNDKELNDKQLQKLKQIRANVVEKNEW